MRFSTISLLFLTASIAASAQNPSRKEFRLDRGWRFTHIDREENPSVGLNDKSWEAVIVPHDWAINGPFDKNIDIQKVAIEQNGEKTPTEKTGRSGSLPWIGVGWYRTTFRVDPGYKRAILHFDGAMSEPVVYVNGKKAGEWKYGYSAFYLDISSLIHSDGSDNTLAVRLENRKESSRWYPGAGLYRPVSLELTREQLAITPWGITVATTLTDKGNASVRVSVQLTEAFEKLSDEEKKAIQVNVTLTSLETGEQHPCKPTIVTPVGEALGDIVVTHPLLWSPEKPSLYSLSVLVTGKNGIIYDSKTVKTGLRTVDVSAEHGFRLNGESRKIKGVCLHHDLGMLGAAINRSALLRQLKLLKDMGADAIRTSHNMPSQWQMELCDSLGMMVMAESFDEWKYAKCKNGYHRYFDDWVERDLRNLVLCNRLHPSIVMWSIGNEIPEQSSAGGAKLAHQLQSIVHRHDPTRPVTAGCDRVDQAVQSGFMALMDIPGLNYRTHRYEMANEKLPQGFILGSETASTVSSRGEYFFPVEQAKNKEWPNGQCSGYDVEACSWSNLPEEDWTLQDDKDWVIGEFVWTGFDYLGEPTPYDTYWPSRSSYFGILDLAGLPKDRFYLYRSRWNINDKTIHLLPHWTWPGREGQVTPVYCYTNYDEAELFVNGKSQGRIRKNKDELYDRYRLRWNHVVYEPGELRVVVYDNSGMIAGEEKVRTAGEPDHVKLDIFNPSSVLRADGENMAFITASVVDRQGNLCPDAAHGLTVKVEGEGRFKGICNGDPTSLESFTKPVMKAFHGQLVIGVQSTGKPGKIRVSVSGKSLKTGTTTISSSL